MDINNHKGRKYNKEGDIYTTSAIRQVRLCSTVKVDQMISGVGLEKFKQISFWWGSKERQ